MTTLERPALHGIGGWLLFFVVSAMLGVALTLGRLNETPEVFSAGPSAVVVLARLLRAGGIIVGLVLLFRSHRLTPAYWTAFFIVGMWLNWLEVRQLNLPFFLSVAPNVIWLMYWCSSERVRTTFGSLGLAALGKRSAKSVLRDERRRVTR